MITPTLLTLQLVQAYNTRKIILKTYTQHTHKFYKQNLTNRVDCSVYGVQQSLLLLQDL